MARLHSQPNNKQLAPGGLSGDRLGCVVACRQLAKPGGPTGSTAPTSFLGTCTPLISAEPQLLAQESLQLRRKSVLDSPGLRSSFLSSRSHSQGCDDSHLEWPAVRPREVYTHKQRELACIAFSA